MKVSRARGLGQGHRAVAAWTLAVIMCWATSAAGADVRLAARRGQQHRRAGRRTPPFCRGRRSPDAGAADQCRSRRAPPGVCPPRPRLPTAPPDTRRGAEPRRRMESGRRVGDGVLLFAGHGDAETLHLGHTRVTRAELQRQLESWPATLRVVVLDTCRSQGGIPRGVRRTGGFDVALDREAAAQGTVIISSTNVGEPALESDEVGGALFTHYWLSGLRGAADSDRDGRVTVAEAYAHAYRHTVRRSAATTAAVQHPMFRNGFLTGTGDIVLTDVAGAELTLIFTPERDVRYLIYQLPSGAVLAEIRYGGRASDETRVARWAALGPTSLGLSLWSAGSPAPPGSHPHIDTRRVPRPALSRGGSARRTVRSASHRDRPAAGLCGTRGIPFAASSSADSD